jgi:hypothetical protein
MKKSHLQQIIREEIQKAINEGIIMSRDKADLKQGEKRNYWAREGFDNSDLYTGEPDKRCQWCMESFHAFGGGRSKDGHVKGDGHTINLHNYEIAARPEKGYAMSRAYSDREY